jgi:SAM-dependent methyltransferase
MRQASVRDGPWFVQAFDRLYLKIYPHRDDAEAERHTSAILRLLQLGADGRVLDVACGAGRHARALARRGLRVTGVDLSDHLLEEARERSPGTPGAPTYLRWDIRQLPFVLQFDGAISMFTSFGYGEDPADDVAILRGIHRALLPGARFLLDFLNPAFVRATLEAVTDTVVDGLHVHMERRIEESAVGGPVVFKEVRATHARTGLEEASFEERVRLYAIEDFDRMAAEAGLEPDGDPYGDFDESPYSDTSPRLIRVYRKPGRAR